jgi:hypothetical protein
MIVRHCITGGFCFRCHLPDDYIYIAKARLGSLLRLILHCTPISLHIQDTPQSHKDLQHTVTADV